jgi:hypothetical protein
MRDSDDPFATVMEETKNDNAVFLTLMYSPVVFQILKQFLKDTSIFMSVEKCMSFQWPAVLLRLCSFPPRNAKPLYWMNVITNPMYNHLFKYVMNGNHIHLWSSLFWLFINKHTDRIPVTWQEQQRLCPEYPDFFKRLTDWLVYPACMSQWLIDIGWVTMSNLYDFKQYHKRNTRFALDWTVLESQLIDTTSDKTQMILPVKQRTSRFDGVEQEQEYNSTNMVNVYCSKTMLDRLSMFGSFYSNFVLVNGKYIFPYYGYPSFEQGGDSINMCKFQQKLRGIVKPSINGLQSGTVLVEFFTKKMYDQLVHDAKTLTLTISLAVNEQNVVPNNRPCKTIHISKHKLVSTLTCIRMPFVQDQPVYVQYDYCDGINLYAVANADANDDIKTHAQYITPQTVLSFVIAPNQKHDICIVDSD